MAQIAFQDDAFDDAFQNDDASTLSLIQTKTVYTGLAADTKPTGVTAGDLCLEIDSGIWYVTPNGEDWEIDLRGWRYG